MDCLNNLKQDSVTEMLWKLESDEERWLFAPEVRTWV